MNIREAILKAADHIERYPKLWDYWKIDIPSAPNCPACAVGWVAHFAGISRDLSTPSACKPLLGINHTDFWIRLTDNFTHQVLRGKPIDELSAEAVVTLLRLYADKYHPAEKPKHVGIPASVRDIFDGKVPFNAVADYIEANL